MHHNHQTQTYPAHKMIPPSVLKRRLRIVGSRMDRLADSPTPAQRKLMKKQHTRRSRRQSNQILEDEIILENSPIMG